MADVDALPLLEPVAPRLPADGRPAAGAPSWAPTPLIGFAGAPFTLATYLIEGGPSKEHARTKAFMYAEPEAWARLLERLALSAATFLRVQVDAGASAVQLFDSWAGVLSAADYADAGAAALARGVRRRSATGTCRGSTSASAPASCCR